MAAFLAAALLVTGCGSTVQMRSGIAADGRDRDGLSAPGGLSDGTQQVPVVTPSATVPDGTAHGGVPGDRGATVGPSAEPGPLPSAFGVPDGGVVSIGYSTVRDSSTATAGLGFTGFATGDMDAQMNALARYVNSHGGLLGRKMVLVNHDTRTVDSINDPARSTEAACAKWTQDHHVFAALDLVSLSYGSNNMAQCLAKRGTLLIADGDTDGSAASYAQPFGPFSGNAISIDRYLPGLVQRLVAQDFFTRWDTRLGVAGTAPVRIGLMHFDNPAGRRYASVLKSALAKHGFSITSEVSYAEGFQPGVQGGSSAVLKFRDAGVTHVFNANIGYYRTAASQQFYARIAVDDLANTPAAVAAQPGMGRVLHGALGAGVAPAIEVPDPQDTTPAATLCKKIMREAGQDYSNDYTLAVMLSECGSVFLLMAAVNRGGELSADGFRRGLLLLGNDFQPTLTYRSSFTATKHDGASAIRDFAYDDACVCFRFPDSKLHPV